MDSYANSVLERYGNPFVRHELMSIALNSVTKYKTRIFYSLNSLHTKKYAQEYHNKLFKHYFTEINRSTFRTEFLLIFSLYMVLIFRVMQIVA